MKKLLFIQSIFAFVFILPTMSQDDTLTNPLDAADTLDKDFGLFTNDEILDLSLRFNMTLYQRKKPKDEYLDAVLTYHINKEDSVNKEIRLKTRGEMRNGYCNFPPIRLNFKDAGFEKEDVKKIRKLKMVTHCQYGNEAYLFKEYLIYKLYNVLTDTSFRVRLLRINYINTDAKKKRNKTVNSYAFLIEPLEILAQRINAIEFTSTSISQKVIMPHLMTRMGLFNYMIGNTDWSVPNQHNCKVLTSLSFSPTQLGIIVPYDFDYAGLVNADYAIPYEGLGLKSVQERRYVGMCRTEETFINALVEFSDKKEAFYKVINDFPLLSTKEKSKMTEYLDEFYESVEKQNVVYRIVGECTNF